VNRVGEKGETEAGEVVGHLWAVCETVCHGHGDTVKEGGDSLEQPGAHDAGAMLRRNPDRLDVQDRGQAPEAAEDAAGVLGHDHRGPVGDAVGQPLVAGQSAVFVRGE